MSDQATGFPEWPKANGDGLTIEAVAAYVSALDGIKPIHRIFCHPDKADVVRAAVRGSFWGRFCEVVESRFVDPGELVVQGIAAYEEALQRMSSQVSAPFQALPLSRL
jgi:hypothetical protein